MDKTVEVSQAARDAAANDQHLVDLLRREGKHSGVWFRKHLLRAADLIEASIVEATIRATQPEAALREALGREEIANIIRDAVTEEESDIDGGYVGNLLEHGCDRAGYDDPHRTSEACIDLAVEGLLAALKNHRHG